MTHRELEARSRRSGTPRRRSKRDGTRPLPTKRPPRRRGPERAGVSQSDFAIALSRSGLLHDLAAPLPGWQPGDAGAPQLYPPALILLFAVMRWGWRSYRAVEREFSFTPFWQTIRAEMHQRYPQYRGVGPDAPPIKRTHVSYYLDTHGIEKSGLEAFRDRFQECAAIQTQEMGLFDPANATSFTHPARGNSLAGDATVVTSRVDAAPGDRYTDPTTAQPIEKRSDPDAKYYRNYDEYDAEAGTVVGTKYVIMHARTDNPQEQVITDVCYVPGTDRDHEANVALDSVRRFQDRVPAVTGLVYDMAIRGTHREELYRCGLLAITKAPKAKGGKPKSLNLGRHELRCWDGRQRTETVWAIGGHAHLVVTVNGEDHQIRLERGRIQRADNRNRDGFRWYLHARCPDDARLAPELRGATVVIRLDDSKAGDGNRERRSRADTLHALAEGDADWERLYDLRNPTESVNSWIKDRLHGRRRRAPAIGAARTHFALLCAAIYNNFQAALAFAHRRRQRAA